VALIQQLARRMSDKQLAAQSNRHGIKTTKGHTWTRGRVGNFRQLHDIANYSPGEPQARGELTPEEAASRLGVSYSTVQRLIQQGRLPAQQICARGPWVILAKDGEAFQAETRGAVAARGGPSSPTPPQRPLLFPQDT